MDRQLILDRYRPLAELGSGGHASVTLAYDTKMGRRVAVKRLPLPFPGALGRRRTGLAEARTVALLNHPAIVTVHEWDADVDEAYVIMEYVEGVSLADVLARLGRLDPDETASVVGPVASALAYGHGNGVLHLDVKPENLLVTREGDVKVADFGIAALTDGSGTALVEAGTLGYMPPEQLRGEPLDARTDVWALATVVYEALTGDNPFSASSEAEALRLACAADIVPVSSRVRGVPRAVDDVLLAALAPDPAERYPDAADFAAALLPHLGGADRGADSLADVVDELTADELAEEEDAYRAMGAWDRLARFSPVATRVSAAAVCLVATYAGLTPLHLGVAATGAGSLMAGVAAAFAPALGVAIALIALDAGAWASGWVQGAAGLVAGAAFWLTVARRGGGDGIAPFAAPLAAVARVSLSVPLLLGFTFGPLSAGIASAASCFAVMLTSVASRSGPPLLEVDPGVLLAPARGLHVWGPVVTLMSSPGPLVAAGAWGLAGAAMSIGCRRGTRAGAALGAAAGAALMLLGYWAWSVLTARLVWPSTVVLQQLVASLILMTAVVALGPPVRGEGDDV